MQGQGVGEGEEEVGVVGMVRKGVKVVGVEAGGLGSCHQCTLILDNRAAVRLCCTFPPVACRQHMVGTGAEGRPEGALVGVATTRGLRHGSRDAGVSAANQTGSMPNATLHQLCSSNHVDDNGEDVGVCMTHASSIMHRQVSDKESDADDS